MDPQSQELIPKFAQCMTSKTRGYCFTLNNYTDDEEQQLQQLGRQVQYLVYGRERGGRSQYLIYKVTSTSSTAQQASTEPKSYYRVHMSKDVEGLSIKRLNTAKDQDVHEEGRRPLSREARGAAGRDELKLIIQHARDGNIDWIAEHHPKWFLTTTHGSRNSNYDNQEYWKGSYKRMVGWTYWLRQVKITLGTIPKSLPQATQQMVGWI